MKNSNLVAFLIVILLIETNQFEFSYKNPLRILESQSTQSIKDEVCKDSEQQTKIYTLQDKDASETENAIKDIEFLQDAASGKEYLRKYLYRESNNDDFSSEDMIFALLQDIAPLLVFTVLSVLGFLIYIFCYFFDCCCPKLICCSKKPDQYYSKFEMRWPIMGQIWFSLWVIVSSIIGLVIGSNFTNGYYILKCQATSFLNDFNIKQESADGTGSWYGFETLKERIRELDDDFIEKVNETFKIELWMDTDYNSLDDQSDNLWNTQENYYSFKDIENTSQLKNSPFYNTRWGPITTENTHTYNIKSIVEGPLLAVYESMYETQKTGQSLTDSGLSQTLSDGIDAINDFQKTLLDLSIDIKKNTDDWEEVVIPSIQTGIELYFSLSIVFCIISILSSFFVAVVGWLKFRVCMHISWCAFSIWMIFGFLLATLLYSVSIFGVQTCDIINGNDDYEGIKNNAEQLRKLDLISDDIINKLKRCRSNWGGKGNILAEFSVEEKLQDMRNLNSEMSESFKQQEDNEQEIQKIYDYLDVASQDLENMSLGGFYVLDEQNFYDWNINDKEGMTGLETKFFVSQDVCLSATNNDIASDGVCDPFDLTIEQVFNDRQIDSGCYNIHDYFRLKQSYVFETETYRQCVEDNKYYTWVKQKNKVTSQHIIDIDTFKTDFDSYQQNVNEWYDRVKAFDGEVSETLDNVQNLIDDGVNCLFIGDNLDQIMDTICQTQIPDVYWLGITLVIHAVGMYCGSLFLFCAGYRFANAIPKQNKEIKKKQKREDKYKIAEKDDNDLDNKQKK